MKLVTEQIHKRRTTLLVSSMSKYNGWFRKNVFFKYVLTGAKFWNICVNCTYSESYCWGIRENTVFTRLVWIPLNVSVNFLREPHFCLFREDSAGNSLWLRVGAVRLEERPGRVGVQDPLRTRVERQSLPRLRQHSGKRQRWVGWAGTQCSYRSAG